MSNYPKDHKSGIPTGVNKKVIGMLKDEASGKQIDKYVGLHPKSYVIKMNDSTEEIKCKGVVKATRDNSIKINDFIMCIDQHRIMKIIRSYKHVLFTETMNKIALSAKDDKRIILEDGLSTIPYGYNK